jgi:hypothetical protein
MLKIAGYRSASGSISQTHGSAVMVSTRIAKQKLALFFKTTRFLFFHPISQYSLIAADTWPGHESAWTKPTSGLQQLQSAGRVRKKIILSILIAKFSVI